ncbi:hypothetical protein [Snodgrassella sp. CFCC 13594]|uniref:hypothetical protein n=1 Tax=Snodgrassella sp. CFCC 13594 TaxID=1775559 RepID=UPI00082DC165|nr:hypothetical protein [Snodgrassella sp. CFCC 13594]
MDFNSISQPAYERAIIMGVTKFQGEIEGSKIDTCTVFIATKFNDETGNATGFGVAKIKFGSSINFGRFNGVQFPTNADVLFERTTNGAGKQTSILKDVKLPTAKG